MRDHLPPAPTDQLWEQVRHVLETGRPEDVAKLIERLYVELTPPQLAVIAERLVQYWRDSS